jgi:hypothetical protein
VHFLVVVYLTTLSAADKRVYWVRNGRKIHNEIMYYSCVEGAVVVWFEVPSHNVIAGTEGNHEEPARVGCVPVQIRTRYSPNTSEKNNHFRQLVRCVHSSISTHAYTRRSLEASIHKCMHACVCTNIRAFLNTRIMKSYVFVVRNS